MTLGCSSHSVSHQGSPQLFCEDQMPKPATPVGEKKDTKLSPGIFCFNRLSKDQTSALLCGLVNYFHFGILNLKTRTLAQPVKIGVVSSWLYL